MSLLPDAMTPTPSAINHVFHSSDSDIPHKIWLSFPKTNGRSASQTVDLNEIELWIDWMRQEFPGSGVALPSAETSVLFALKATHLAERVRKICRHFTPELRALVMQSSILDQCWMRQKSPKSNRKTKCQAEGKLRIGSATTFVKRWNSGILMEAADGAKYLVKFPRSDRETALATECISIELARAIGLPTPDLAILQVSSKLSRQIGIVIKGWPRYISNHGMFECLGLRCIDDRDERYKEHPSKTSGNARRYLNGFLIFNILVLNLSQETANELPVEHYVSRFLFQSECLLGANWPRFIRASYRDWPPLSPFLVEQVKSPEHLEYWIRRALGVDFNRIWELAFNLPPCWYGERRDPITRVLRKLESRVAQLRETIHFLTQQGYFPNINISKT